MFFGNRDNLLLGYSLELQLQRWKRAAKKHENTFHRKKQKGWY